MEYLVGISFLLAFYSAASTFLTNRKIKLQTERSFSGEMKNLDWETKRFIDKLAASYVSENRKQILDLYEKSLKESMNYQGYVEESVQKATQEATRTLIEESSKAYVKQHLPEIVKNLDVKAVSNALLLKMTGQVM